MFFHQFIKELLRKLYRISKSFTHIEVSTNIQGYIYFQGIYNFSPTLFSEGSNSSPGLRAINSSLAIERLACFLSGL